MKSIIKKIFAMFMVFMLSLNTFAAIVADNDGSAFVTKSEFEALKSDFNKQVQNYKDSLEGKIDGAIASYLAGIKISYIPKNYWDLVKSATGSKLRWKNNRKSQGASTITVGINEVITRQTYLAMNSYVYGYSHYTWGTGFQFMVCKDTTERNKCDIANAIVGWTASGNRIGSWTKSSWANDVGYGLSSTDTAYRSFSESKSSTVANGSGNVWLYEKNPDGTLNLMSYNSSFYPQMNFKVYGHSYKNYKTSNLSNFKTYYTTTTGLNQTDSNTTLSELDFGSINKFGSYSKGTSKASTATSNGTWGYLDIIKVNVSDNIDYSLKQWGSNSGLAFYCLEDNKAFTVSSTATTRSSATPTYDITLPLPSGPTNCSISLNGFKYKYYPISYAPESKTYSAFSNKYLSAVAGEDVKLGGGAPLLETYDNEQRLTLQMTFKLYDANNAATTGSLTYKIGDKQFSNGSFQTGATQIVSSETVSITASSGKTITKDITVAKKGLVWININPATSGHEAELVSLSIKVN